MFRKQFALIERETERESVCVCVCVCAELSDAQKPKPWVLKLLNIYWQNGCSKQQTMHCIMLSRTLPIFMYLNIAICHDTHGKETMILKYCENFTQ